MFVFIYIFFSELFVSVSSQDTCLLMPRTALESQRGFIMELLSLGLDLALLLLNLLKSLRIPKAFLNVLCCEIDF